MTYASLDHDAKRAHMRDLITREGTVLRGDEWYLFDPQTGLISCSVDSAPTATPARARSR